jgi:hypothetical protein
LHKAIVSQENSEREIQEIDLYVEYLNDYKGLLIKDYLDPDVEDKTKKSGEDFGQEAHSAEEKHKESV